jgi:hypothetical protein
MGLSGFNILSGITCSIPAGSVKFCRKTENFHGNIQINTSFLFILRITLIWKLKLPYYLAGK